LYPFVPIVLAQVLVPAIVCYWQGWTWIWWVLAIAVGIVVLLLGFRRIDLDAQGITFVPFIPLLGEQRFGWSDLGVFEWRRSWGSRYRTLQAPIMSGRSLSALVLFRSSNVIIPSSYGTSPFAPMWGGDQPLPLIDSYRATGRATT
jgi:hypothetical protein